MNCAAPNTVLTNPDRSWPARLHLQFEQRQQGTRLVSSRHEGPLRVQRPFYPEQDDCCHVYLLHPPGGMVIGDDLQINAQLKPGTRGLITTPAAGKIYGAKGCRQAQTQAINLSIATDACLEWLPQETIVFNSANGRLHTRINLAQNADCFAWDIVRLGRQASGETFASGYCFQSLEIYREGIPLFIERNRIEAGGKLQNSVWGLQNKNTFATLIATCKPERNVVDELSECLDGMAADGVDCWALSQKEELFIARYLGDDVALCRKGFELIWRQLRPCFNGKAAVPPRIWNT